MFGSMLEWSPDQNQYGVHFQLGNDPGLAFNNIDAYFGWHDSCIQLSYSTPPTYNYLTHGVNITGHARRLLGTRRGLSFRELSAPNVHTLLPGGGPVVQPPQGFTIAD